MTEHSEFSEICITLNIKEYSEIFTSEVADFTNEGLEFAESGVIIIRTSKDRKFIDALLAHLRGFCKDLSAINNQNITFSHTITRKQNKDWIEEYKRGIKPLRCGRFYIYPPWEKPSGNSPLELHSADFGIFGASQTPSLVSAPKIPKNYESQTENPSVVDSANLSNSQNLEENSAKIAESALDSAESENLNKNNSVRSTQTRPLRGAKNRIQGCSSVTADFLLEAEKRGSPPKSEKVAAFWEHNKKELGGAGRGGQPFLRKESSEISGKEVADSALDSVPQDEFATINIILEPSLAFGTGHHASTFMCIEAIQALDSQYSLKNKKLLDFGCGSGILALCASKLGAVVDLCDIDESAIVESKKNFNNNNATISHIWQGGIDKCATSANPAKSGIYDIIVANIIASVLIEQKDNIDSSLKCGGIAVLSGILDIYKDEVLARFSDFTPLAIHQSDEWICAILQKNKTLHKN